MQTADAGRGIGRYVRGLLDGLVACGRGDQLAVLIQSGFAMPDLPAAGLVAYSVNRRWTGRLAVYEDAARLAGELAEIDPLLFHATRLSLPSASPCPLVVTMHDLIPWAMGGRRLLGERLRYRPALRLVGRADRVIAVSNATAEDAVRLGGVERSRIRVIGEGVDSRFRPAAGAGDRVRDRWGLAAPYLFFVGAQDPRKNLPGLLRAWQVARHGVPGLELALAGAAAGTLPVADGLHALGRVTDEELVDLLSGAACLVLASRYEGFGLPILEAMACGCPVAAFANSSIPEVAGGAAALVPDGDAEALGRAAAELVSDAGRAREARRRGLGQAARFSWESVAREVAGVYSELLA